MYTKEALEQKIKTLKASIETIDFQIQHLKNHRSPLQVTAWRKNKAKLKAELEPLEAKYKSLYKSKPVKNETPAQLQIQRA